MVAGKKGDIASFEELLRRYYDRVVAVVYNMLSNREDTEDAMQDILIKVHKNLKKFRCDSSFYTWFYRVAINQTINFRKKRTKKQTVRLAELVGEIKQDPAYERVMNNSNPVRKAKLSELQKKLNEAVQTLSDKHKQVVILHDIQGLPHEQIAVMEKCSVGTIRSRLFYARQLLQQELKEYMP